ncbi:hypothetical protein ACQP2Y_21250 [Actinoplanes sp. CA-051413]|uniref:hypothetical protein n=1 Tax=Actinoplanes sp. CA-051413 TaxID=3239899 RepID=UPI003D95EADC
MSERTITLSRAAFDKLREGRITIRLADSGGRRVAVFPQRVWPSARVPALQPSVVLNPADLDLIERDPEGLVCASTDGTTGWTVRLA